MDALCTCTCNQFIIEKSRGGSTKLLKTSNLPKKIFISGDFYVTGIEIWAGFGPVGITENKNIWADYQPLLRQFYSNFHEQNFLLKRLKHRSTWTEKLYQMKLKKIFLFAPLETPHHSTYLECLCMQWTIVEIFSTYSKQAVQVNEHSVRFMQVKPLLSKKFSLIFPSFLYLSSTKLMSKWPRAPGHLSKGHLGEFDIFSVKFFKIAPFFSHLCSCAFFSNFYESGVISYQLHCVQSTSSPILNSPCSLPLIQSRVDSYCVILRKYESVTKTQAEYKKL